MEQNDALLGQEAFPQENQAGKNQNEALPPERQQDMEDLLEQEGLGIDFPAQGEIRTGAIAKISPNEILVSIGTKSQGVITGRELEIIPHDELPANQLQKAALAIQNAQAQRLILSYRDHLPGAARRQVCDWKVD